MRTKTLVIAVAALAAGILASSAQTYSQNIVGYANVVIAGNGQYTLLANPFDDGNGNYLTNILNSALPIKSQVLTWDPILTYTTIQKGGSPVNWPAGTATQLPPGTGFFVRNGNPGSGAPALTNTFVGTVIPLNGSSVTNDIGVGYTLQGSVIPYAGNIATVGLNGGDTNLDYGHGLTRKSQLLTWDPVLTYTTVQKGGPVLGPWTWGGTATIGVGQGFFINNVGTDTNMVQSLNLP
jgi:hypothetical protein